MKRNIIGYLLLLIAAVSLNSCSDDNEDTPEQKKQYSSLVSEFLETYNFKSTETGFAVGCVIPFAISEADFS